MCQPTPREPLPSVPSTPRVRRHALGLALALPLLALVLLARVLPVRAASVIEGGSPADCTYSALVTAMGAGGLIQFNCGPAPVTIPVTDGVGPVPPSGNTIDGGNRITLSATHFNRLFVVATGRTLRGRHHKLSLPMFVDIQPAGKPLEWEFIRIFRLRGGKIVEHWAQRNNLEVRQQLRAA